MHNTQAMPWLADDWPRFVKYKQRQTMPHALLFRGSEGIGKLGLAEQLCQYIQCKTDDSLPCDQCKHCHWIQQHSHPDVFYLKTLEGKKSISITQIRELMKQLNQTALQALYQVVIIKDAELMTRGAANALLKTLEEPAGRVVLMLVTANPHRLPATIISRCQQINIKSPTKAMALTWVQNQIDDTHLAERALALHDGSPKLAVNTEQLAQYDLMLQDWLNLSTGKTSPTLLAGKWHKQDVKLNLVFIQRVLMDCIRYTMALPVRYFSAETYTHIVQRKNTKALFHFFTTLQDAIRAVESATNPNPQLLLDNLMIAWCDKC